MPIFLGRFGLFGLLSYGRSINLNPFTLHFATVGSGENERMIKMPDAGLWFVDTLSTSSTGVKASAVITTPSSYQCQAVSVFQVGYENYRVPDIVWYAFISAHKTNYNNWEAGILLDQSGQVWLFQLGAALKSPAGYANGWDAVLISGSKVYGREITLTLDLTNSSKAIITATWPGSSTGVKLEPEWASGHSVYNSGAQFKKEITLGTNLGDQVPAPRYANSDGCLNQIWSAPFTTTHRQAYVTNFKMGPVTIRSSSNALVETMNNTPKNYHVVTNASDPLRFCALPPSSKFNPTVTHSSGLNTLTADLR